MALTCMCASEDCQVNGCRRFRQLRQTGAPAVPFAPESPGATVSRRPAGEVREGPNDKLREVYARGKAMRAEEADAITRLTAERDEARAGRGELEKCLQAEQRIVRALEEDVAIAIKQRDEARAERGALRSVVETLVDAIRESFYDEEHSQQIIDALALAALALRTGEGEP